MQRRRSETQYYSGNEVSREIFQSQMKELHSAMKMIEQAYKRMGRARNMESLDPSSVDDLYVASEKLYSIAERMYDDYA